MQSSKPFEAVFIGGCPRSGTTMLADHLSGITGAFATPESLFINDPKILKSVGNTPELKASLLSDYRFLNWGLSTTWVDRSQAENVEEFTTELLRAYAEKLDRKCEIWVDHSPGNFKRFQMLNQLLPTSHFIHIVRDPRAVVSSVLKLDWGPNTVKQAAEWWLRETSLPLALQAIYPAKISLVKYEDIISADQAYWHELISQIGLGSKSKNLTKVVSGANFQVPAYTRRQHSLVGKMSNKDKISSWRSHLGMRDIEIAESITYELMLALGYEPDFLLPKGATRLEKLMTLEWPVECKSRPFKLLRKKIREKSVRPQI